MGYADRMLKNNRSPRRNSKGIRSVDYKDQEEVQVNVQGMQGVQQKDLEIFKQQVGGEKFDFIAKKEDGASKTLKSVIFLEPP